MCFGNLFPRSARTSASVLPTRLLAAANPRRSGTVSRSQTMTDQQERRQPSRPPASSHLRISLAVVAATAATFGRISLAKLSRAIVRQRLLSEQTRRNVDAIRHGIEGRPVMTFGTLLAYAFSPLPSNYLFIAYGLTSLPLTLLALPFFVGRLVSYAFWISTASAIGDRLELDWFESAPYFVAYFIVSQLLLIPIVYGFTRVDWHAVFAGERFKWLRRPQ